MEPLLMPDTQRRIGSWADYLPNMAGGGGASLAGGRSAAGGGRSREGGQAVRHLVGSTHACVYTCTGEMLALECAVEPRAAVRFFRGKIFRGKIFVTNYFDRCTDHKRTHPRATEQRPRLKGRQPRGPGCSETDVQRFVRFVRFVLGPRLRTLHKWCPSDALQQPEESTRAAKLSNA